LTGGGEHLLWAFPCSLGAAAAFGASNVAQIRAARRTESRPGLDPTLLARLVRSRLWLAGLAGSVIGYTLQAIALFLAPVVLVQPVIVTELLFALAIAAALAGVRLGPREWSGATLVAAGLATIVFTTHPSGNRTQLSGRSWTIMTIAVVLVVAFLAFAAEANHRRPMLRASLLAAAASVCFGLLSIETKVVGHDFVHHRVWALLHPQPYLLAVTAVSGLLFAQTAFRIAPMSVSLPIIDIGEPLSACVLAIVVLHERFGSVQAALVGLAVGATCLVGGVSLLDTSPLVRAAHFEPPALSGQCAS
jgi:drug/metabolite transporter (DMT)-like permease